MAKTKTLRWMPRNTVFLEAALEEGDPSLVAAAPGNIARARGMT